MIYGEAAAYWILAYAGMTAVDGAAARLVALVYTFFFTSLTLEKLMPSARSRV